MRAIYYNPEIKAFINEDTVIGNVADTLSLNRYAYGKGNPLSYVDPSGHEGISNENVWEVVTQKVTGLEAWKQLGIIGIELGIDIGGVVGIAFTILATGAISGIGGAIAAGTLLPELIYFFGDASYGLCLLVAGVIYTITGGGFIITTYKPKGFPDWTDFLIGFSTIEPIVDTSKDVIAGGTIK